MSIISFVELFFWMIKLCFGLLAQRGGTDKSEGEEDGLRYEGICFCLGSWA